MPAIAAWLVARPQNAVLGLAVSLLLPASQLTGGVVLVLLVLAQGIRLAVIETMIAAAILVAISLILGVALSSMVTLMALTWIPALLLVTLLIATRSLTLAMQVSVIAAVVVLLGFAVAVDDPAAFWQPYLNAMQRVIEENGLQLEFNIQLLTAEVMTVSAVLAFWIVYTSGFLLGYGLYRQLPGGTEDFGRFKDMNFGRVIALAMALSSIGALVIDVAWLRNTAFVLFAIFMMQGLAMVHWLRDKGILPGLAVVSVYVLLPILQILLVLVLAFVGYTDAWFGFRRRLAKT